MKKEILFILYGNEKVINIFPEGKPVLEKTLAKVQYDWSSYRGLHSAQGRDENKQSSAKPKFGKKINGDGQLNKEKQGSPGQADTLQIFLPYK